MSKEYLLLKVYLELIFKESEIRFEFFKYVYSECTANLDINNDELMFWDKLFEYSTTDNVSESILLLESYMVTGSKVV
jgi:hypothetical protein